jgi:hypothetical protein
MVFQRSEPEVCFVEFQSFFREIDMLLRAIIVIGILGASPILRAQSEPTASRVGDLKVGGGFSIAASDYGGTYNGGSAFVDFDFLPRIGVEGGFHFVKDSSNLYEKTYEVGGRYYIPHRKFIPYGKLMFGRGVFNFPPLPDGFRPNLGYNLMAAGIGTDYRVNRSVYVRADWEYQKWFGFENSSLSPSILTIGGAYHFR